MKQTRFETTDLSDEKGFSTKELVSILIERFLVLRNDVQISESRLNLVINCDEMLEMLYKLEQELQ